VKYGINTFLFASPFTTKDSALIEKFKKMGFDGVEIPLENKGDIDYKEVAHLLKANDMECSSVCGAFGPGRDLRGTEEEQEASKQYIRDCIDACTALECNLFVGPLYSMVGRAQMEDAQARKRQWEIVVKNVRELCSYAEKSGVWLALEPLNRFETDFINTCKDAKKFVENVASSMLKIHLDTFHMNIEEKSLPAALLNAGDLLYHVHTSENDRGAPGTGTIDWKGVKEALNIMQYDRYLVIESFTPDVEIIARAASIWRSTEPSAAVLAEKGLHFLKALFAE